MKFSTKLSLSFAALLAAALCAVGLAMVGRSFADGIASAGRTFSARQYAEKYSIESTILSQPVTAGGGYTISALSGAVQSFAEQTPGSCMALYLDGRNSVYSNLPRGISRTDQLAALEAGTGQSSYLRAEGQTWLLLTVPLNIPGVEAVLLSAYDVTSVFASRDAQLTAWFVAAVAVLAAGAGAAGAVSRSLTRPLTRLQSASSRIAAGDYTQRTRVDTDDEIGALSRSFDAMAGAVESRIAALDQNVRQQKDFIAAFTHEIKTPMTSMLGYADLMRARPQSAETQREAAGYIFRETHRLEELSRKLLALMGLENLSDGEESAIRKAPVTDRALFARLDRAMQTAAPDAVPIRWQPGDCTVLADAALLDDLLRNLILNARRACAGKPDGCVTVSCRAEGKDAVFAVQDNGCGIPAEDLPRVVEPFYMVDKSRARAGGGSGIGLTLCQRIAQLHGSRLEFASTVGQGTTVSLRLPLEPDQPEKEAVHAPE
ncbi:cell wall metabolism sensor histidine kinase WalK [uncultured Gemmiger sp.]|uniref:sensor histidine kinase n=1 Tax=uncultured Gemmiger sp. TaxID=1623490 RepID=UPI0025EBA231|nr:HAMP domain-containing sensor histidine kinase [uncultured Gemmiger sp.]